MGALLRMCGRGMMNSLDPVVQSSSGGPPPRLRACCAFLLTLVNFIAMLVLAGWIFNIEILKRLAPGFVAMNPATAVCFLLAAVCLYHLRNPSGRTRRWILVVAVLVVGAVGAA